MQRLTLTCISLNPAAAPVAVAGTRVVGLAVARDVEDKTFEGEVRQVDGVPPVAVSCPQVWHSTLHHTVCVWPQ